MARLAIKLDHIAALRALQAESREPNLFSIASMAEIAGCDAVVVQLHHQREYVQDNDIKLLGQILNSPIILEMEAGTEMMGAALSVKPDQVIIIPEKSSALDSDRGVDLMVHKNTVAEIVKTLQDARISAAILIDPDPEQVKLAHLTNADGVAIHAGSLQESSLYTPGSGTFESVVDTVKYSSKLNMNTIVCRGIDYTSIKSFAGIPELDTFIIGHSIISRAVSVGMDRAVRDMQDLIKNL